LSGGPLTGHPQFYGFINGDTAAVAQFHTPIGLAVDSSSTILYVADRDNNAIRKLDLTAGQTITFATFGINKPVGVAVDAAGNVFVLNHGNGSNGTVEEFNSFGNFLGTLADSLGNANGIALDSAGNVYVTVNNDTVIQIAISGFISTIATVPDGGTVLQGIAVLSSGNLAVSDAGNNGVYVITPATGTATPLTGFNGAGDKFGTKAFVKFNQPYGIAAAGGGMLVLADYNNNRVKVIDPSGTVTNLYGVASNFWVTGQGTFPGWWDGTVCQGDIDYNTFGCVEARIPAGVAVAPDGTVYATEDYYHIIRKVTATGLTGVTGGGSGGTNILVVAPIISPNSGYYPMGQLIMVSSPAPNVHYTTDGSEPTINSPSVSITANVGFIRWFNSTNDLTALRVKAFIGTNSSITVSGVPVSTNNIGVPPGPTGGAIYGGIGSSIVVPLVMNLQSNVTVKSYQFRVEITPIGGAPAIPSTFTALNIDTNDFIQLVTPAQVGGAATNSFLQYNIGSTIGLLITAVGPGANVSFQRFANIVSLKVPIPPNANEGDSYSIAVSFPSATSDGLNATVPITAMAPATIVVQNIPYTVGDSASPFGAWYNAGTFGDGNLDNSDVNNAFYAAAGLRVPYSFSDVFNAMDAFPPDNAGFVGGDGQIRFLDWETVLLRAVRLDPSNWAREWSPGGNLISATTNLTASAFRAPMSRSPYPSITTLWNRQVLLGAGSVGNVLPGNVASIPVYVKMADGATLSGMQFRVVITAQNGAPALSQVPQLIRAPGISVPTFQQSFLAGMNAFGWQLGSFNFQSRSSNFLGWITFTIPANATAGQSYTISFANADGSPNATTQYEFETRSASAAVASSAVPPSICSDEWKVHYFGSLTAPSALDAADPDGDGVPNWMEFVAGTDPTDVNSKLHFSSAEKQVVNGQSQIVMHWQSAPGKAYEILWSTSLTGASWNSLGTVSGDGNVTAYTDAGVSATGRFYRLRVLP
jgi:streptogramin lyase